MASPRRPDMPISDDDLLRRIAENDQAAFGMLVARHVDRAYALALRILRNPADAEDAVQDSLLKVWAHRHRWEFGRARFSTFLCRVVINRCIDLYRRPRPAELEETGEPADMQPDAVTTIHRAEVSHLLDAAVSRLPDRQRMAVLLSYHEGLSNDEIAEVLETTVFAVESLLKRARVRLRALLQAQQHDIRLAWAED